MKLPRLIALGIATAFSMQTPATFAQETATSSANNSFGFKMLSVLKKSSKSDNLFISPLSISQALKMALNGAGGKTKDQMVATLELQKVASNLVNKQDQEMVKIITTPPTELIKQMKQYGGTGDPTFKLTVANSLWGNKNIVFNPSFIANCTAAYNAEVRSMDFADPRTVSTINQWTSIRTAGKIPSIIDRLTTQDLLVLLNAVYFKAAWKDEFRKEATKPMAFLTASGSSKKVPTMNRQDHMSYLDAQTFQMVGLPYADNNTEMYVILPKGKATVDSVLRGFTDTSYTSVTKTFDYKLVEIFLPKFKFDYSKKLQMPLGQMGMQAAFSPSDADFKKMILKGPNPYISAVIHKSYVDVNEEGTEAAAVTAVSAAGGGMPQAEQKVVMKVDHPFLFFIVNKRTNAIIFLGIVGDPTKTSSEDP